MPYTIKTTENRQISKHIPEQGNAMIYVLIAIALFGFLTMTLSRQNDQSDGQDMSDEQAALYANELLEYVASAENVIDMMRASGSEIGDLSFVNPTSAVAFTTTPHIHKVFHPQGGGLNYQATFSEDIQNDATAGWVINRSIDVEWTKNTDNDAILTAYFIARPICEIINQKITGSKTIPVTTNPHADYFLDTGTTDFDTTECATCEGYRSLCVENSTNDNYSFYNIIATEQ